jgi:hypothetical protein
MSDLDRVEVLYGELVEMVRQLIRETPLGEIIDELEKEGQVAVIDLRAIKEVHPSEPEPCVAPKSFTLGDGEAEWLKSIGISV